MGLSCFSKATSGNMTRSYRNVPRQASSMTDCSGICHLCLAGRPNFDYEDLFLAICFPGNVSCFYAICLLYQPWIWNKSKTVFTAQVIRWPCIYEHDGAGGTMGRRSCFHASSHAPTWQEGSIPPDWFVSYHQFGCGPKICSIIPMHLTRPGAWYIHRTKTEGNHGPIPFLLQR